MTSWRWLGGAVMTHDALFTCNVFHMKLFQLEHHMSIHYSVLTFTTTRLSKADIFSRDTRGCKLCCKPYNIGRSRGCARRTPPPPKDPYSFILTYNIFKTYPPQESIPFPLREILDPPLYSIPAFNVMPFHVQYLQLS